MMIAVNSSVRRIGEVVVVRGILLFDALVLTALNIIVD